MGGVSGVRPLCVPPFPRQMRCLGLPSAWDGRRDVGLRCVKGCIPNSALTSAAVQTQHTTGRGRRDRLRLTASGKWVSLSTGSPALLLWAQTDRRPAALTAARSPICSQAWCCSRQGRAQTRSFRGCLEETFLLQKSSNKQRHLD